MNQVRDGVADQCSMGESATQVDRVAMTTVRGSATATIGTIQSRFIFLKVADATRSTYWT